jgi:hypothetical protein
MITGPQGTPYENGCFIFDIYLPGDYNAIAPMVSLMTTNGGKYRYNPNLYADGVSQPAVDSLISTIHSLSYTPCTESQRSQSFAIYTLPPAVCSCNRCALQALPLSHIVPTLPRSTTPTIRPPSHNLPTIPPRDANSSNICARFYNLCPTPTAHFPNS